MTAAPHAASGAGIAPAGRRGRALDLLLLGALSSFAPLSIDMYLPALRCRHNTAIPAGGRPAG